VAFLHQDQQAKVEVKQEQMDPPEAPGPAGQGAAPAAFSQPAGLTQQACEGFRGQLPPQHAQQAQQQALAPCHADVDSCSTGTVNHSNTLSGAHHPPQQHHHQAPAGVVR
jgi:hypothetical protein